MTEIFIKTKSTNYYVTGFFYECNIFFWLWFYLIPISLLSIHRKLRNEGNNWYDLWANMSSTRKSEKITTNLSVPTNILVISVASNLLQLNVSLQNRHLALSSILQLYSFKILGSIHIKIVPKLLDKSHVFKTLWPILLKLHLITKSQFPFSFKLFSLYQPIYRGRQRLHKNITRYYGCYKYRDFVLLPLANITMFIGG